MKIITIFIFFLLLGAFFIISQEEIKLNSRENIGIFFNSYQSWINKLLDNGKTVSGYVVNMKWLPE